MIREPCILNSILMVECIECMASHSKSMVCCKFCHHRWQLDVESLVPIPDAQEITKIYLCSLHHRLWSPNLLKAIARQRQQPPHSTLVVESFLVSHHMFMRFVRLKSWGNCFICSIGSCQNPSAFVCVEHPDCSHQVVLLLSIATSTIAMRPKAAVRVMLLKMYGGRPVALEETRVWLIALFVIKIPGLLKPNYKKKQTWSLHKKFRPTRTLFHTHYHQHQHQHHYHHHHHHYHHHHHHHHHHVLIIIMILPSSWSWSHHHDHHYHHVRHYHMIMAIVIIIIVIIIMCQLHVEWCKTMNLNVFYKYISYIRHPTWQICLMV